MLPKSSDAGRVLAGLQREGVYVKNDTPPLRFFQGNTALRPLWRRPALPFVASLLVSGCF